MMDLATETGTTTYSWGENQIMFDSDKRMLSRDDATEVQEFVWETIKEAFDESNDKYSRENREKGIPPSKSLADFFAGRIQDKYGKDKSPESLAKLKLVEKTSKMWGAFVGQSIEKQSLKFFWLEECLEGNNLFCADSYYKILQRLMAPVVEGAAIKFNSRVSKIKSKLENMGITHAHPSIVCETFRGADSSSDERTNKGSEQIFDELVVTTPLGWLQRNPNAFEPQLPQRISKAISALGYGNLDKVYISFPSAFWNTPVDHDASIPPTNNQQTVPNITATTAPIHQASTISEEILANDPNFPGFATFLAPDYARETNPMHANQELLNFAALPGECSQPTLLFYIYGEFANHVASIVSDLSHRPLKGPADPAYIQVLWPLFEPYVALLPNYDTKSSECQPVDMLATAWVNDELAGNGSYTNFPVGLTEGDEDVETIREGLPERGLWFAGEHTAPFVALGTVSSLRTEAWDCY